MLATKRGDALKVVCAGAHRAVAEMYCLHRPPSSPPSLLPTTLIKRPNQQPLPTIRTERLDTMLGLLSRCGWCMVNSAAGRAVMAVAVVWESASFNDAVEAELIVKRKSGARGVRTNKGRNRYQQEDLINREKKSQLQQSIDALTHICGSR